MDPILVCMIFFSALGGVGGFMAGYTYRVWAYWKCDYCGRYYKPSRGERLRLEHFGASGAHDGCPCYSQAIANE